VSEGEVAGREESGGLAEREWKRRPDMRNKAKTKNESEKRS
jgi:hypothetical protein